MAYILKDVATEQTPQWGATAWRSKFNGPWAAVYTGDGRGHIQSDVDALTGGYVGFAFTDGELGAEVARGARQTLPKRFPNIVFADARTLALEGDNPYINHKHVARAVWLGPEIKKSGGSFLRRGFLL